jgi:hypothetical protein
MIRPPYQLLRQLYPRKDTREVLFSDIGWSDLTNPAKPSYRRS